MLNIMELDFKIVDRPVIKHKAADALTRLPTNGLDRTMLEDNIPVIVVARSNKQTLNSTSVDAAGGSHAQINSTLENKQLALLKFIEAERPNIYCNQNRHYVGLPNNAFTYEKKKLLAQFIK